MSKKRNYRNENVWYPLFKDGIVRGVTMPIYTFYIYNPALNRRKRIMYELTAYEECQRRNALIAKEATDDHDTP